jgi:hypothetical protein
MPAASPLISGVNEWGAILMEYFHDYLAFDFRNIDQSVLTGMPPGRLEIVRGRFDPDATDRALGACSECPPPLREEHLGVSFYSWGVDDTWNLSMKLAPPAFDQVGRGGRIAVQGDQIFRTLETPEMKALIEASLGKRRTLADVEEFRLLANWISKLGAYAVLLSDQTWTLEDILQAYSEGGSSPEKLSHIRQELEEGPLLRPYQTVAMGGGYDEDGGYMALVLVHADTAAAEENVGLLQWRIQETTRLSDGQPWAERIDSVEISTEGRVLLAKLRGRIALGWRGFLNLESVLVHE